jgi:hypothetical protein
MPFVPNDGALRSEKQAVGRMKLPGFTQNIPGLEARRTATNMSRNPNSRPSLLLSATCIALVCYGLYICVASHGFFNNLLGALISATGGGAFYLMWSIRQDRKKG